MSKTFLTLPIHLTPNASLIRNDSIGEKNYTVVPMVMMVEGVHAGSDGPLLYKAEELSKIPHVWNTKPVVVNHPEQNGQPVTACSPDILPAYGIGMIMNAEWDAKAQRLKAEAWLEPGLVSKVDNRVSEAIENNEMMEVSIGVYVETMAETGEWEGPTGNSESYIGVATNLRPDHLAVLPDSIGACSIEDGAGLLRNERKAISKDKSNIAAITQRILNSIGFDLKGNELSHHNIYRQLRSELVARLNLGEDEFVWVEDVYSNFFIYEHNSKLYRLDYSVSGEVVEISGEPSEVVRVTEYRNVDGSFVGNNQLPAEIHTNKNKPKENNMDKNSIIANLLKTPVWNESNKEFLDGLEAEQLQGLLANAENVIEKPTENAPENKPENKPESPEAKPTDNKGPKEEVTLKDYVESAPAEIRDTLTAMSSRIATEKDAFIEKITACETNKFTEDQLKLKSYEELANMSALIPDAPSSSDEGAPSLNYSGQLDPAGITENSDDEPLTMPSVFEDKS